MVYKILEWNENVARIDVSGKGVNGRSFVFDISLIAQDPEPKEIIFQHRTAKWLHEWSLSWEEFGKIGTVGAMVLSDKKQFRYSKKERASYGESKQLRSENITHAETR